MSSSGLTDVIALERCFHLRVVRYFHETRKSGGPTLHQLVWDTAEVGGLLAVRRILHHEGSWPFSQFQKINRLDLTLEAMIVEESEEWAPLFTRWEIARARRRLTDAGYIFDSGS